MDVFLVDCNQKFPPGLMGAYSAIISGRERVRWSEFAFKLDATTYLISKVLMRTVLTAYQSGRDARSLRFQSNDYGKPCLDPSDGTEFNLSHSGGFAALAVTKNYPVGVDIETYNQRLSIWELSRYFLTEQELVSKMKLEEAERDKAIIDWWTMKESIVKADGRGLSIPLTALQILSRNKPRVHITNENVWDEITSPFKTANYRIRDRFSLSISTKVENNSDIRIYTGFPLIGFKLSKSDVNLLSS